jgi:hypothetical protein
MKDNQEVGLKIRVVDRHGKFLQGTANIEINHRKLDERVTHRGRDLASEIAITGLKGFPVGDYKVTVAPSGTSASVHFRLEASDSRMWKKWLVMPDAQGSQWDIVIEPVGGVFSAENSLWAHQVHNSQSLELWKAKAFGVHHWMCSIKNPSPIAPGTKVVFRWLRDGS